MFKSQARERKVSSLTAGVNLGGRIAFAGRSLSLSLVEERFWARATGTAQSPSRATAYRSVRPLGLGKPPVESDWQQPDFVLSASAWHRQDTDGHHSRVGVLVKSARPEEAASLGFRSAGGDLAAVGGGEKSFVQLATVGAKGEERLACDITSNAGQRVWGARVQKGADTRTQWSVQVQREIS